MPLKMNEIRVFMLAGFVIFAASHCSGLTCCIGKTELVVSNKTDEDQKQGEPCTNHGTSCKDISCPKQTCTTNYPDPDTVCGNTAVCSTMTKPVCRLLYYEYAEDQDPEDELSSVALEKDIQITNFAEQACFENVYDDVTIGCEFYPKIFYESKTERKTYQKECFCDKDLCNENLVGVCLLTDPDLKGKDHNFTCWEKAAGSPKTAFTPNDKYIISLTVFTNLIISLHLFSRKL